MTEHIDEALLRRFIALVEDLADTNYDDAPALFDLPKYPDCPPLLAKLAELVDVDQASFTIEKYFSAFLDDIHHHGDINETAGDGLMIIFRDGEPPEHALGAVRTALAIRTKAEAINTGLFGHFDELTVNVGINSGTALVGSTRFHALAGDRFTFNATGSVTNIAARIGALARQGAIFIGPGTARRVRDQIALQDLGLMSLQNVSEPIRLFQVVPPPAGLVDAAA